jgi:hypothetical protein
MCIAYEMSQILDAWLTIFFAAGIGFILGAGIVVVLSLSFIRSEIRKGK